MRNVVSVTVSVAVLAGAGALYVPAAENWLKDDKLVAAVEDRVHKVQPSRAEKRLDEIGWVPGILAAEKLARANNRPIFLFTYDGNIDTGRC
jgi:hypothetical protein